MLQNNMLSVKSVVDFMINFILGSQCAQNWYNNNTIIWIELDQFLIAWSSSW